MACFKFLTCGGMDIETTEQIFLPSWKRDFRVIVIIVPFFFNI